MNAVPGRPGRGGTAANQRLRAADTRSRLIRSGRELFGEVGFHAAGIGELGARAGLTQGALYHHFGDKTGLFEAVFRAVLIELNTRAQASAVPLSGDLWRRVAASFDGYLRLIASSPEFQRILLIDGPVVLGWRRWRALQAEHVGEGIATALRMLMEGGIVARHRPEPLARLIHAALNDTALAIAHAPDPHAARAEAAEAFAALLDGLRIDPARAGAR